MSASAFLALAVLAAALLLNLPSDGDHTKLRISRFSYVGVQALSEGSAADVAVLLDAVERPLDAAVPEHIERMGRLLSGHPSALRWLLGPVQYDALTIKSPVYEDLGTGMFHVSVREAAGDQCRAAFPAALLLQGVDPARLWPASLSSAAPLPFDSVLREWPGEIRAASTDPAVVLAARDEIEPSPAGVSVVVAVSDLSASRAFYEGGLGLRVHHVDASRVWFRLGSGGDWLILDASPRGSGCVAAGALGMELSCDQRAPIDCVTEYAVSHLGSRPWLARVLGARAGAVVGAFLNRVAGRWVTPATAAFGPVLQGPEGSRMPGREAIVATVDPDGNIVQITAGGWVNTA